MSVLFNIWDMTTNEYLTVYRASYALMLVRPQPRWARLSLGSVGAMASDRFQLLYLPSLS